MSHSPAPIFLPLLEESQPDQDDLENDDEELVDGDLESGGDGGNDDLIHCFFKSRTDIRDPRREAGLRLQKNRRTSWRIAETVGAGELGDGESEVEPFPASITSSGGVEREGIVGEILAIARGLPQNTTLGEVMDPYSGRVGEKECLEVLGVMGDEGWGFHCLYLLEWMGLQEPSLVTPRAYSIVFPVLGKTRMGEQLMILVKNLPAGIQFRDLRVYNAAISGLSSCGR